MGDTAGIHPTWHIDGGVGPRTKPLTAICDGTPPVEP